MDGNRSWADIRHSPAAWAGCRSRPDDIRSNARPENGRGPDYGTQGCGNQDCDMRDYGTRGENLAVRSPCDPREHARPDETRGRRAESNRAPCAELDAPPPAERNVPRWFRDARPPRGAKRPSDEARRRRE